MWIHHLFSFLGTFLSYFFTAIGTTILGWILDLAFLGGIAFCTLRALHSAEGWKAVVSHWEKEKKIALRYALWCSLIIYGPIAVWKLGQAAYDDHRYFVSRAAALGHLVKTESDGKTAAVSECQGILESTQASLRDKTSVADTYQKTFVAMQGPQAQQQANITTCIDSLAKMNPQINEEIVVISIPLYTSSKAGKIVGAGALFKTYTSELIIFTNENEVKFHGIIRCQNAFVPNSSPDLPETGQTVMKTFSPPTPISDREYEISAGATGTEWSPAHPAYFKVTTTMESPGSCTFTPKR